MPGMTINPRKMSAKQIRDTMEGLASLIEQYDNEYEEYERELKRRGLKAFL